MLVGRGENPLTFPIGLVLDDQLFALRILASHHLELQRTYLTEENNWFMFDILNRGLWDQDVMDSPSDAASRGIQYLAVMGKQLWRLISGNTLQVGEPKYPFCWKLLTVRIMPSLPSFFLNFSYLLQDLLS